MNVKISEELMWLEPYLKKVSNIVPVHKIEKIVAGKPRVDQIQHCQAQLVTETNTKTGQIIRQYITMNLYYLKARSLNPLERMKKPYSKVDLLETLAHELAHFEDIHHTPKHKKLQNKICTIFMNMLEKTGYVSEEHEMKTNKPRF